VTLTASSQEVEQAHLGFFIDIFIPSPSPPPPPPPPPSPPPGLPGGLPGDSAAVASRMHAARAPSTRRERAIAKVKDVRVCFEV
jgi:hypothetical protein